MRTQQCPSEELLRQFDSGLLDDTSFEEIAQHIDECLECCEKLSRLEDSSDIVMQQLRETVPKELVEGDSELEEMIAKANSLLDSVTSEETLSSDSDTEGGTEGLYSQLEPPIESDEIGRLGDYRILKCLGAGGMGVVFQAEDTKLKRLVALKVMKPNFASNSKANARFLREAQATAGITHDNIVTIHQVGEANGVPYFAMQLLEGESLAVRLKREEKLPLEEVLRIGREVAAGLQAAHQQGLSHRDIKPDNLWLEAETGRVKILDFGLARAIDDTTKLTQSGMIVGTPSYLSPEQADGTPCDPRCDQFSLGIVLYELATGISPFKRPTMMATLLSVSNDVPCPVNELERDIPPSFASLVSQLLQKDPAKRFDSAEQIGEALSRIEDEVEQTDRTAIIPKLTSEAKPQRMRWGMVAALLTGVFLVGAFIVLLQMGVFRVKTEHGYLVVKTDDPNIEVTVKQGKTLIYDSTSKREFELKAGQYEIEVRERKNGKQSGIHLFTKNFVVERNDKKIVDVSLELAKNPKNQQPTDQNTTRKPIVSHAIVQKPAPLEDAESWTIVSNYHHRKVNAMDVHPAGELIATGGEDRELRIWKDEGKELVSVFFGHEDTIQQIAWSPDGKQLASASKKGTVILWDAATGKQLQTWKADSPFAHMSWSPDGQKLAVAYNGKTSGHLASLKIWEAETGKLHRLIDDWSRHPQQISRASKVVWLPDGKSLIQSNHEGFALRDTQTGKTLRQIKATIQWIFWEVSPDGKYIAMSSRSGGGTLHLLQIDSGKVQKLELPKTKAGLIRRLSWSLDSRYIAFPPVQYWLGCELIWDMKEAKWLSQGVEEKQVPNGHLVLPTFTSNNRKIIAKSYHPHGTWDILVMDIEKGTSISYPIGRNYYSSFAWNSKDETIAVMGHSGLLHLWNAANGTLLQLIKGGGPYSTPIEAWTKDDTKIFSGVRRESGVRVIDLESRSIHFAINTELLPKNRKFARFVRPDLSDDCEHILGYDLEKKTLVIIELNTHKIQAEIKVDDDLFRSDMGRTMGSLSASKELLATYSKNVALQIREVSTGKIKHVLKSAGRLFDSHSWSPDGTMLATYYSPTGPNKVLLWHAETGKLLHEFDNTSIATSVAWTPDSSMLAFTTRNDPQVQVWSTTKFNSVMTLPACPTGKNSVKISHDGKMIGCAGIDGVVRFWELATGRSLGCLMLLPNYKSTAQSMAISSDGHIRGTPLAHKFYRYVVKTEEGQQTFTAEQFKKQYGWKNDEKRITFVP